MKCKILHGLSLFLIALGFIFMFCENVEAYIDPSVMTYAIQAGAGIVIAIGAVVGIYWHKAKRKISDKIGIDENKNKEVETDEIIVKKNNEK